METIFKGLERDWMKRLMLWSARGDNNKRRGGRAPVLTSSDEPGFFFSSSHFLNLQIWWPVLRFRQLLQTPQLISRRQGAQTPHLFLFFLAGFPLDTEELFCGQSARLAI